MQTIYNFDHKYLKFAKVLAFLVNTKNCTFLLGHSFFIRKHTLKCYEIRASSYLRK